jgi:aminopeptidase N
VQSVRVDGSVAAFRQEPAEPPLEGDPQTPQLQKLIGTPARGIDERSEFELEVAYHGEPREIVDPDGSSEGWVRACAALIPSPLTCHGSFVVNEPNGAQGWFPNNNVTKITAPTTHVAIGIGELDSRITNGDGTRTWTWTEGHPTASYLTTASVGRHDYAERTVQEAATGRTLPDHRAIAEIATSVQKGNINTALDRTGEMLDFLGDDYGPYPFASTGAVVDMVPLLGYALEVQTRPHFSTLSVPVNTPLHEHAHHWFGNSVSPATWLEIWHNEGWAEWSTWYWAHEGNGSSTTPAQRFQSNYDSASEEDWSVPPATLNGDPANLFAFFPVYVRSAMTLEGYRQIVGDETFFAFARVLLDRYGYSHVTSEQVIELALEMSGLGGESLELLGDYFQQWLYGSVKPTILPAAFAG